jgi:hypothetical protein
MPPRIQPQGPRAAQIAVTGPGAYPVDPYNRPSESNLGRLASALGNLAPGLQRIAAASQEDDSKAGEEKAYTDFLAMQEAGKDIKSGALDPAGSPWFRRHYHETIGRLAASKYSSDLTAAMNAPDSPLANSTEPGDFDAFAADFRSKWLEANVGPANADFTAGFNPVAVGLDGSSRASFASQASKRLQGQAIEALYAEHQVAISNLVKENATSEQIADYIKIRNRQQYFLNPKSGRQISETTIEAVFDAARTHQDARLLDVLQHVDSAVPGATLADTQAVRSKIQDVRNQINSDIKKDDAAAELGQKKQRQQAVDSAIDGLWEALDAADDPDSVDVKPFADTLTGISPKDKDRLYAIKNRAKQRDEQELAAQAGPLFERAFRGSLTFEEVADAYSAGQIGKDSAKELRAQIRANKAGKGARALVQDADFTKASSQLDGLFKNQMDKYFSPITAAQATVAMWTLQRDWVKYRMGEGKADAVPHIWLQQRAAELFANTPTVNLGLEPLEQAKEILSNFAAQQNEAKLTDWKTSRVVASSFLARIRKEYEASVAARSIQFSPAVRSYLDGYRINKPADVLEFLNAQSAFPER